MADQPAAELFTSDQYDVIDISYTVEPGERVGRPFTIERSLLADESYKYDVRTHSHVGSHVEGGRHFYGDPDDDPAVTTVEPEEDNRAIIEYPLESFYGPGVLMPVAEQEITEAVCEECVGDIIEPNDVVVIRNETTEHLAKEDAYSDEEDVVPTMTEEAARWFADWDVKALVFADISLGETVEVSNIVHDVLMSRGCTFVEIVDNLDRITQDRFSIMYLPYKVEKLGSSFCRAVVIQDAA